MYRGLLHKWVVLMAMSCIIRSADHVLALIVLKPRPANVDEATPSDSIQITSNNIVYALMSLGLFTGDAVSRSSSSSTISSSSSCIHCRTVVIVFTVSNKLLGRVQMPFKTYRFTAFILHYLKRTNTLVWGFSSWDHHFAPFFWKPDEEEFLQVGDKLGMVIWEC